LRDLEGLETEKVIATKVPLSDLAPNYGFNCNLPYNRLWLANVKNAL